MAIGDEPKPTSFTERDQKIKDIMLNLYESISSDEQLDALMEEIKSRVSYLRGRYPEHINRRILHVLMGSSISDSHSGVIDDDFPGDDSVEKFVHNLVKKYSKKV